MKRIIWAAALLFCLVGDADAQRNAGGSSKKASTRSDVKTTEDANETSLFDDEAEDVDEKSSDSNNESSSSKPLFTQNWETTGDFSAFNVVVDDVQKQRGVSRNQALRILEKTGENGHSFKDSASFALYAFGKISEQIESARKKRNEEISLEILQRMMDALVYESTFEDSAKLDSNQKPFLYALGSPAGRKQVARFVSIHLNDEIDFQYSSDFSDSDDKMLTFIACDPQSGAWCVWSNLYFKNYQTLDEFWLEVDMSVYNVSAGVFDNKYNGKKRAAHLAYLRKKYRNAENMRLRIERNAERRVEAAQRNAARVGRQNAAINAARENQRRMNGR